MTYAEYIRNYLEQQGQGAPIYTDEIADAVAADYEIDKKKAAAATAVAIKRIMDKGKLPDLRCYQKGVYYRTVVTSFGEMGISREKLIANKYLLPDKGYETGLRLLHHMGLTTQKDKNAFRVLPEQIHERNGYRTDVLEKDYYVVLMLRELAEKQEAGLPAFFKGGTVLYKALKTTNRFSEDIDLSVDTRGCSRSQNMKRLELAAKKYTALARDASAGKMNWSEVISILTYEPITAYDANDTMLYEPATESEQNILRELPLIAWRRCGSMHWHFARYGHL